MPGSGLRVTGGNLRGRRLRAPSGGVRPTADRVREAVFARLDCEGTAVLDLFAGTGALGIEAASRGARSVVFVERHPGCAASLRRNLHELGLEDSARVVRDDARRAVARLGKAGERFDLVLLDPPYGDAALEETLAALVAARVLAEDAVVVVEHGRRHPVAPVAGLATRDERRYGDTMITRLAAADPAGGEPPAGGRATG